MNRTLAPIAALLLTASCSHHRSAHDPAPSVPGGALERVAAVHGAAGPFAVAGYRMGERALKELGLPRGSFDLEVVHEAPPQVQWSCIADGLQASTGTSPGKLNLKVVEVSQERTTSVVRDRRSGKALRFTLTHAFVARWKDLPHGELPEAGAAVVDLPDREIFDVTPL